MERHASFLHIRIHALEHAVGDVGAFDAVSDGVHLGSAHFRLGHIIADAAKEDVSFAFEDLVIGGGMKSRGIVRFAYEALPQATAVHLLEGKAVAAIAVGAVASRAGDMFSVFRLRSISTWTQEEVNVEIH